MANRRWVGFAVAIADKWTLTVANTWAPGDIARVTIGNKDLLITVGSATLATIAEAIAAAYNAQSAYNSGGSTSNVGGQQFQEFAEAAAEASGATVIITATAAGHPIGVTSGETTAGTGTLAAVNTTPATGPNFLDNPDNYESGTVPVDNDVLYVDTGAVDILYALTHFRAGNIDLDIVFSNDWTGRLGLPQMHGTNNAYPEYRQRYFQYRGGSKSIRVIPGLAGNTNAGPLLIDLQDQASVTIDISGSRGGSGAAPGISLAGSDTTTPHSSVRITAGRVAIEPADAPTASGKGFATLEWLIGNNGSTNNEPHISIGSGCRLTVSNGSEFQQGSGTVTCEAELRTDATHRTILVIDGGTFEHRADGLLDVIDVGPIATLRFTGQPERVQDISIHGGTLDLSQCPFMGATTGDILIFRGSTLNYPVYNDANPFKFVGCSPNECNVTWPTNRTFDVSVAAS